MQDAIRDLGLHDKKGDGSIGLSENMIKDADEDKDGSIDLAEFRNMMAAKKGFHAVAEELRARLETLRRERAKLEASSPEMVSLTRKGTDAARARLMTNIKENLGWRVARLVLVACASALLSLGPVLFPFGDPFDLTLQGFLNNAGYFFGYTGLGWASLFLTNALWVHRLLNVTFTWTDTFTKAVLLPMIFSVAIFLGMYVVMGGPMPLGTLSLGGPCFVVSWVGIYYSLNDEAKQRGSQVKERGIRVIGILALWVVLLCMHAVFTVMMLALPKWSDIFATGFVFSKEYIDKIDIADLMGKSDDRSPDQELAAVVMHKMMFLSLHATYQAFLFPVLTKNFSTVVFSAVVSTTLSILSMQGWLTTMTERSHRGSDAAAAIAAKIFDQFLSTMLTIACPFMFSVLLAFNQWGWNHGMFYQLDLKDEMVLDALVGCAVNCGAGVLEGCVFFWLLHEWLKHNTPEQEELKRNAPVQECDLSELTALHALTVAMEKLDL